MRRPTALRPFAAAALAACAAFAGSGPPSAACAEDDAPAASDPGAPWPFGAAEPRSVSSVKLDLYNLGLLGAKARDADAAPQSAEPPSGMRRVEMSGDPKAADDGPNRLRVEMLFPDGPAHRAGLRPGDVIVGVSGKSFKEGSLGPLAQALVKAESGQTKGGVVALTVERGDRKEPLRIDVVVPQGGKDAATPAAGRARDALLASAASWLAKRQAEDGGFAETLSGSNGAVVQTACAGLVWLATGSDLTNGPFADNVARAARFVASRAGEESSLGPAGGANWSQVNWGLAHGAIFLGELHARSPDPDVAGALVRCAEALVRNQEASGGWAHGPGGPNALGYVELNIVSGLALGGLGLAQRAGFAIPAETLRKAEEYIVLSGGGDGGVGYSTQPGQRGAGNIGRTAGTWLGVASLGMKGSAWGKKLEGYVRQHAGEVYGGHASLMQHHLLAGVAAQAVGADAAKTYWAVCERDLVLARAPDGSFQPRPWHESLSMRSNSDVSFGEVWTTAAWAIVLGAEPVKGGRPGLPAWTGRLPPLPAPKRR